MEYGAEYVMSKLMYDQIVSRLSNNGKKKIGDPKTAVINYLNDTAGVKGEIFDIIIKG